MSRVIFQFLGSLLLLLLGLPVKGQSYVIPDQGLKECILERYPQVLDFNGNLDIAKANAKMGDLFCSGYNIQDISGIEHFSSIITLNFPFNQIADVSKVIQLPQLQYVYFHNNQIEEIPDFSSMNRLKVLHFDNNQISQLTPFPNSIQELYFGTNRLTRLEGINQYTNLRKLYVFKNQIEYVSDISSLTILNDLHLGENNIRELKGYENLWSLQKLSLEQNPLSHSLDLSKLKNLRILYLNGTGQTEITDFSDHRYLSTCFIGDNKLTFEDIVPQTRHHDFNDVFRYYWGQDSVGTPQSFIFNAGESFSYNFDFDQNVESNRYSWYKNGKYIETLEVNTFSIEAIKEEDEGVYHCEIRNENPLLYDMVLHSRPISIIVNSCEGDCDEFTFTPNGDGLDDQFYIPDQGVVKIFDKAGNLLKKLQAPTVWDGTNENGEPMPYGFYLIQVGEGKLYKLTLLK